MIRAIFAVDNQGGLGKNGTTPWPHDPEDIKWFVTSTKNQIVVMGSKTWHDPAMPAPLPKRINVVISNKHIEDFPGTDYVMNAYDLRYNFDLIIQDYPDKDIWIIGGAQTLITTRHLLQGAYITHFHDYFDSDVRLDMDEWLQGFTLTNETPKDNKTFRIYTR
jgi:dihydrofolate reductase